MVASLISPTRGAGSSKGNRSFESQKHATEVPRRTKVPTTTNSPKYVCGSEVSVITLRNEHVGQHDTSGHLRTLERCISGKLRNV